MTRNGSLALAQWYKTESVWNCAGGGTLPGDKFKQPFAAPMWRR